jgi:hypothetical protein
MRAGRQICRQSELARDDLLHQHVAIRRFERWLNKPKRAVCMRMCTRGARVMIGGMSYEMHFALNLDRSIDRMLGRYIRCQ